MTLPDPLQYAWAMERPVEGTMPVTDGPRPKPLELSHRGSSGPRGTPPEPSDEELLGRVGEGDREALGVLFDRYHDAVYRYLRGQVGDGSLAEDLLQETFLRVWRAGPNLPPVERGRGYLFRVALNLVRDHHRWQGPRVAWGSAVAEAESPGAAFADRLADRDRLRWAMAHLSPEQRVVVGLHYFADRSVDEVSSILNVNPATVKTRLHRAYRRLAKLLREEKEGDAHGAR